VADPAAPGVDAASRAVAAGDTSALALLEAALARIDALEPRVRAWQRVDREGARRTASELDAARAGGGNGPLDGVPIGVKDIFWTRGLVTTSGSKLRADFVPDRDATAVARLRAAGAVIVGKTRTSEWAMKDPTETRNPWRLEHTPGGSSSGSAAAVACGMVSAALGSQTAGSTIRPAAYCGVVGLKPTRGRVSLFGVEPVSFHLDHVGVFARSALDAALVLDAIAGPDPLDPLCAAEPAGDHAAACRARSAPPRIGLVRDFFFERCDAGVRAATERAAGRLERAGARVDEVALPADFASHVEPFAAVFAAEAAAHHAGRFAAHAADYGPEARRIVERGLALPATRYAAALLHRLRFSAQVAALFGPVDLLLTPAAVSTAPRGLASTGDPALNAPWSYSGLPALCLPTELLDGLPCAVQLVARPFADAALLALACWCERALGFAGEPPL
jgi:aspartyl-tRNA(Asn)/glutamyl-tRNA(Gln) amidotransferase subunit A